MTFRKSVVPAALALAGCLPTESERPVELEQLTYHTPMLGGSCEVEDLTYSIYAEVTRPNPQLKAATTAGALLVTVAEGTSVVDCGDDIVRVATPGAELAELEFASSSDHVAFEVPGVIIGGHRPSIRVSALLDANGNGKCDDGELTASFEGGAEELGDLALELADDGCFERQ